MQENKTQEPVPVETPAAPVETPATEKKGGISKPIMITCGVLLVLFVLLALCGGIFWYISKNAASSVEDKLAELESSASSELAKVNSSLSSAVTEYSETTTSFDANAKTKTVYCADMDLTVDIPVDWYKTEEVVSTDESKCFLTQQRIRPNTDDQFEVGFTIEAHPNSSNQNISSAYDFVSYMDDNYKTDGIEYLDTDYRQTGYGIKTYLVDSNLTVYYIAVQDNENDTLYYMWFEAPDDKWDTEWPKGQDMMSSFIFP